MLLFILALLFQIGAENAMMNSILDHFTNVVFAGW